MSVEVVVTGIGLVSALGTTQQTWHQLLAGRSGIQRHQPFSELPATPMALIHQSPMSLLKLAHQTVMAALVDAKLELPLQDCAVVVGSSRGQQRQWEDYATNLRKIQKNLPSSVIFEDWLDTLPHAAAVAIAHYIGCRGPVLAPMAACATGIWAIAQAYELLQSGSCERAIAGAVEAPVSPLTLVGFNKMGALAKTGAYPFDRHREGLVLGEGGAVLILETAEAARRRLAPVYGRILGFGLTADGYHVSAPNPHQREAAIAIQQCLDRSQLDASQVNYIHAHGTATQLNDRNEAALIQRLFPATTPVSSTKGATGHTLGASGAIGTALSLLALHHQILPPCVGLTDSEFDLNVIQTSQPAALNTALCLSFGFGGQNGAIALGRA